MDVDQCLVFIFCQPRLQALPHVWVVQQIEFEVSLIVERVPRFVIALIQTSEMMLITHRENRWVVFTFECAELLSQVFSIADTSAGDDLDSVWL